MDGKVEKHAYFVWEVQNTPTFIAFIYFTIHS